MTIPILIIDNYDSFTYNLYQLLQESVSGNVEVHRNDKISFEQVQKLAPQRIVLSPGPGHPAIDEDFGICKEIIVKQSMLQCPILGVCLGHQGIVQHLGGKVVRAPQIVHGKSSEIVLNGKSPLFDGLPANFQAMRYHSLVAADDDSFPKDLEVLAREREHNLIMAIQHKTKPIYGVQFHPESIGTPEGKHLLRNFLDKC
jgi:anthranilate synthase/aminodeoxychorismate synthase-like glutamine amidotransferase